MSSDVVAERRSVVGSVAAVSAVLLVTGLAVLRRLDAALADMHLPGDLSVTASGLTSWTVFDTAEQKVEAIKAWKRWDVAHVGWSSTDTFSAYVLVDILAVALPLGALLWAAYQAARQPAQDLHQLALAGARRQQAEPVAQADREAVAAQTEAIANLVRLGPRFILLYVFFDVAEDLLAAGVVATASPRLLLGVAALSVGKWLALLGCVVPLLLVAVGTAVARQRRATAGRGTGSLADELVALRAQVLVVLVLAIVCFLPGDTGKQVDDGMLLLVDRPGKAAATIVVAVLLGVLLWASGRWCLRAYCEVPGQAAAGDEARQPDQGLSRESLIGLAAAGVVLLAAGLVGLFGDVSGLVALCVPGAAVLLFALLSVPVRGARPRQWGTREPPERLLWWLAAAPALLLGLVAVRGGALVAVTGDGRSWWFLGAGLVGLAVGLAVVLFGPGLAIRSRRSERAAGTGNVVGWLIAAAMLGVAGWAAAQPIRAGETIGAWTVILVFSAVLLAAVAVLVLLGDKLPARGPLAVVGLRRVPLVPQSLAASSSPR